MKRNMIIALGTLGLAPAAVAAPRTMPPSAALSVQQQRMASQPKTPQLKPYLLKITIKTGDDDLRSDSSAWLDVVLPDGRTRCTLRGLGGETWENKRSHLSTCLVKVRTPREMNAAHFTLQYRGEPLQEDVTKDAAKLAEDIFQSWDNWNVDEARIEGEDPTTHRKDCILYATGSPFVRMTAQNRGIELIPANQPCP